MNEHRQRNRWCATPTAGFEPVTICTVRRHSRTAPLCTKKYINKHTQTQIHRHKAPRETSRPPAAPGRPCPWTSEPRNLVCILISNAAEGFGRLRRGQTSRVDRHNHATDSPHCVVAPVHSPRVGEVPFPPPSFPSLLFSFSSLFPFLPSLLSTPRAAFPMISTTWEFPAEWNGQRRETEEKGKRK